jgi:mRNA interferase MazF
MPRPFIPDRGDLIWLEFNPQAGHEQAGHRPAIVLSPSDYNGKVGLAIICPITSQAKGYPFEVPLPSTGKVKGVVLADQVKNLDWRIRKAQLIAKASSGVVEEVLGKLGSLLQ